VHNFRECTTPTVILSGHISQPSSIACCVALPPPHFEHVLAYTIQLGIVQRLRYVCEQLEGWQLDWSSLPAVASHKLLTAAEVLCACPHLRLHVCIIDTVLPLLHMAIDLQALCHQRLHRVHIPAADTMALHTGSCTSPYHGCQRHACRVSV
jgi:hypothetical protein